MQPSPQSSDHEILDALTASSRPALTDHQRLKLLREWEGTKKTIDKAKKMLEDAIVWHQKATDEVVQKLGPGDIRYNDTLYRVRVKKGHAVLEPQKKKPK